MFRLQIAIEPFALFHHSVFEYMCFIGMLQIDPICGSNYNLELCIRIKGDVSYITKTYL